MSVIQSIAGLKRLLRAQMARAFIVKVSGFGLLFLMNVVLARRMGASHYGTFSYALALVSMLSALITFGVPTGSMRFVAQYLESKEWDLVKGNLLHAIGTVLVGSMLASLGCWLLAKVLVVDPKLRQSLGFVAVLLPLASYEVWRAKAVRGLGKIYEAILPQDVLLPGAVAVAVWLSHGLEAHRAVWIYFLALVAVEIVGSLWLVRSTPEPVKKARARFRSVEWTRVSFSMVLGTLMQTGLNRTDVLMMGMFATMEATGVYNAASRAAFLCSFGLRVVNTVVPPQIAAAHYSGRKREVNRIIFRGIFIALLGAAPVALVLLAAPRFVLRFFGHDFVTGAAVLSILAVGQLINAATGPVGFALLMTGNEVAYSRTQLMATLLNLGVNAALIPLWGAIGAAVATAASTAVLNVVLFYHAWRGLDMKDYVGTLPQFFARVVRALGRQVPAFRR